MKLRLGFAKCIKGLSFAKTILGLGIVKPIQGLTVAVFIIGLSLSRSTIVLLMLWSAPSYARNQMEAAHNPAIKANQQPIDIFKESLHPFMLKNCSECHGDNAYYPVGPKHSGSDPNSAFEIFTKLLNPNDYNNSRFITFASNRHYCKDHNFNCENQEQVNADLNNLFTIYVGAVTALPKDDINSITNASGTSSLTSSKSQTDNSNFSLNPMSANQKSFKAEPTAFVVKSNETTTHSEQIQVNNVALTVTTKVRVFKPDFIKVVHVSLSSHQKIDLTLEGIEIKINGYLPTKATGLEEMPRDLSFDGLGIMTTKLTLTREVILKAKSGDNITVKLLGLRTKDLSSIVAECEKDSYAQQVLDYAKPYLPIISSVLYGQEGYGNLNRNQIDETSKRSAKQICSQILIRINKDVPSQSTLVQQLPKDLQADAAQNLQKLLTTDSNGEQKLGEILFTASYGDSICYALTNDVFCIGEHYYDSSNRLRHVYVPQGVKRLRIGNAFIAIEDMKNNWRFIDSSSSLPLLVRNEKSYKFGEDIVDLKMFSRWLCYLNSKHELYCGGERLNEIINFSYDNSNFIKMTDIKIKEFYMSSYTLFAVGLDNKNYYWGRRHGDNDLEEYRKPINFNFSSYEFLINKKIKNIIKRYDEIIITTIDDKIYLYTENLRETKGSFLFGDNYTQGQEISEGLKFTELGYLEGSICGLTVKKELFCRGTLQNFLKYESNPESRSNFTKVSNAPKNIKKVFFGFYSMCFLLDSNEITCAGELSGEISGGRDNQGRIIFTGGGKQMLYQAPHLIAPIRN